MTMLWGVRHANTKDKDKYTWAQYNSDECRTHSWTRGSSVASGSLRPFGPVNRLGGGHSASEEGHFRQISIVPKTFFLIFDDIFRSYGMCLENIWLVFMHFSHFMAH